MPTWGSLRHPLVTAAVLASVGVCAVGGVVASSSGAATEVLARPPQPTPASAAVLPAVGACLRQGLDGVKPQLTGLVAIDLTQGPAGLFHAESVTVRWADLDAGPEGGIRKNNPIDAALARARAAGECDAIKIRVLTGVHSPDWVKELSGGPVPLYLAHDRLQGQTARFWTEPVMAAYARLQADLAARYDTEPRVQEVAISGCMTFYAEPMLRQLRDTWPSGSAHAGLTNREELAESGYTATADAACQRAQIDAHRSWRHTRSSLALNPYEEITGQGSAFSVSRALAFGQHCRAVLGSLCVLGNNSIRWPSLSGRYVELYAGLLRAGPPLSYQMASPDRVGDVVAAATWAVEHAAGSVEMVAYLGNTLEDPLAVLDSRFDSARAPLSIGVVIRPSPQADG